MFLDCVTKSILSQIMLLLYIVAVLITEYIHQQRGSVHTSQSENDVAALLGPQLSPIADLGLQKCH